VLPRLALRGPGPDGTRRRITVLGGGITGLAAAYTLARARGSGAPIEEFLIEGSSRLGGAILTEQVEGFLVEAGPDSFLAEKPEAASLCRELGLGESLIGSNDRDRRTYILHRGRLVPLPDGLMLLAPTRLWPMVRTPLLPLASKAALAAEWFTRPRFGSVKQASEDNDESVASFVRRHFGDAMLENIADPLLAAIFGGDTSRLSVRSALPRFREMEQKYGSLTRAALEARKQRSKGAARAARSGEPPPLFMTLKEGLGRLIERLSERLDGCHLRLKERVTSIEPLAAADRAATGSIAPGYRIRCEGGSVYEADAVILALPAHQCGQILASFDSTLAAQLTAIPYSSGLTVSLAYDAAASPQIPRGFGFLAPRKEKRRLVACTFMHQKFPHRAPEGCALLRCFLGGARDPGVLELSDNEIVTIVRQELAAILSLSAEPQFIRIYRWPASMPQYELGHAARVAAIEQQIEKYPGVFVAGNAYSGVGISDCIRTGSAAAERAQKFLAVQSLTEE
jgi:protoporphyrinogen/coproporphyrinogen III oxidase